MLGAAGYIGRHLVAALHSAGHQTRVHGMAQDGTAPRADLADPTSLSGLSWDVDCVFMLAGVTGTGASFPAFERYVRGNEVSLLNVLDSIRQSAHRPRVVFPSSRLVYRGADRPLIETDLLEARTVYAASKIACEFYLRAYTQAHGIPHTTLRTCVPYGNTQGSVYYSYGTVGNFIRQAQEQGRIRLYGDGGLRRSFTHVDDFCRVAQYAAQSLACANETFNVPGEDYSLREAAELVAARTGAAIECSDWPELDLRIESGSTVFDASKLLAVMPDAVTQRLADWSQQIAFRGHT